MPKLTWIVASKPLRRLKAALTLQVPSAIDALPGEDGVLENVIQDIFLKEQKSLRADIFRT
jgi:hypothetical protein